VRSYFRAFLSLCGLPRPPSRCLIFLLGLCFPPPPNDFQNFFSFTNYAVPPASEDNFPIPLFFILMVLFLFDPQQNHSFRYLVFSKISVRSLTPAISFPNIYLVACNPFFLPFPQSRYKTLVVCSPQVPAPFCQQQR